MSLRSSNRQLKPSTVHASRLMTLQLLMRLDLNLLRLHYDVCQAYLDLILPKCKFNWTVINQPRENSGTTFIEPMEGFKSGQIIINLALAKGVHSYHNNFYYLHVDFRSRFDINISGIASCFSSCQNDHNKSAFGWFLMRRNRELPGVFQASSSRDLKPTGFLCSRSMPASPLDPQTLLRILGSEPVIRLSQKRLWSPSAYVEN
ncbi:hypothetical protein VNO77_26959 [Canavalia gladiata]|uniref:Uncharacterized protein n=1 Tax=Canavalia gladiata TaxID=3824 RepID=A0AAN9KTA1_CANGL